MQTEQIDQFQVVEILETKAQSYRYDSRTRDFALLSLSIKLQKPLITSRAQMLMYLVVLYYSNILEKYKMIRNH